MTAASAGPSAGRSRQFKLTPVGWGDIAQPDYLRRVAAERDPQDTPSLYRLTVARDDPDRSPWSVVMHLPGARNLYVVWYAVAWRMDEVDDVRTGVDRFLRQEDEWRRGRFQLGADIGWYFTAVSLRLAAEVLRIASDEASEAQDRATIAEVEAMRHSTAETPHTSSRVLSEEESRDVLLTGVIRQSLMLLGLAIENAAKGLISRSRVPSIPTSPSGLVLPEDVKSHDLVQLLSATAEPIDNSERVALRELTEWVTWRGRYPTPGDAARFEEHPALKPRETYDIGHRLLDRLLNRHSASTPGSSG